MINEIVCIILSGIGSFLIGYGTRMFIDKKKASKYSFIEADKEESEE